VDDYRKVLRLVAEKLDSAGIEYMVSGSTALGFYGRPRMTRDLDIVIELSKAKVPQLDFLFSGEFSVDVEEVREAVERRSMFNLVHVATVVKVDFIVRKESEYRRVEFGRRRAFDSDGQRIQVVAVEDLVLSKLAWAKDSHSEFQLKDVRSLFELQPAMDREYLVRWARELGVEALLAEVSQP
jgi:predicted nucleotidyltransferase